MFFKNLKLGTRLGMGFGVVLILLSIVAYVGTTRLSLITGHLQDIVTNKNPKVAWAYELIGEINLIARSVRNVALSNDQEFVKQEKVRIEKARANFAEVYGKLEKTVTSGQGKENMARIRESQNAVRPLVDKAVTLALAGKSGGGRQGPLYRSAPSPGQVAGRYQGPGGLSGGFGH